MHRGRFSRLPEGPVRSPAKLYRKIGEDISCLLRSDVGVGRGLSQSCRGELRLIAAACSSWTYAAASISWSRSPCCTLNDLTYGDTDDLKSASCVRGSGLVSYLSCCVMRARVVIHRVMDEWKKPGIGIQTHRGMRSRSSPCADRDLDAPRLA